MANFPPSVRRVRVATLVRKPAAYLGGFAITSITWSGTNGIRVNFTTTYTGRHHQLYVGRTRIGSTNGTGETVINAPLQPSFYPQYLQLVSVEESERTTDYGDSLPDRPYNVVRLRWETAASGDTKWLEVTGGATPGAAVDTANVLENVLFDTDRVYVWTSKPLSGSGTWNFEVAGRDDKPLTGNRGTALPFQATRVLACPPDVVLNSSGNRLRATVAAGVATIRFDYPEW